MHMYHHMKMYGGEEVEFHMFFKSALGIDDWSSSYFSHCTPRAKWAPEAVWMLWGGGEIPSPVENKTLVTKPVASHVSLQELPIR